MISSRERAIEYIKAEAARTSAKSRSIIEPLDGDYSRVHLGILDDGLSAETLGRIFFLSSRIEHDGKIRLEEKLCIASKLIKDGAIPLDPSEFNDLVRRWAEAGYPAIHHSDEFRTAYLPAYRVILNEYVNILPHLLMVDRSCCDKKELIISLKEKDPSFPADILLTVYGLDQ